jgi:protein-glucosylgalactosylhydroxylysine glucosidase
MRYACLAPAVAALLSLTMVRGITNPAEAEFHAGRPAGRAVQTGRIDRRALVARHNPTLQTLDPDSPLSVGNGQFAFTVDVTGLQTFPDAYEGRVPLGTLSDWGWHTAPNPGRWSIDAYRFAEFDSHGRRVGYADIPGNSRTPEVEWLRGNPHRLHLGQLGFELRTSGGRPATLSDLADIEQSLDLWNGVLTSRFSLEGQPVEVQTVCHPDRDAIAVRVRSGLLRQGRIAIRLAFPYGTGATTTADWTRPNAHETTVGRSSSNATRFIRRLDGDRYWVDTRWAPAGRLRERARHQFAVEPLAGGDTFEFTAEFAAGAGTTNPAKAEFHDRGAARAVASVAETLSAARRHWNTFWTEGGAIDLSESRDPRWRELERRIVLSQYLTAIQCAGRTPPQETGLTYNSWEGKFHLEMHWWHAAQFALWNRLPLLERSLGFYGRILPKATATATRQGYRGARWPKMTDPSGSESPSAVGPFLVWQQPHPIAYAELVYRARPTRETLESFRDVVFATAEFMASYATKSGDRYVLGPPLQCAQEVFPKDSTTDCTFELSYWRWGLEAAQAWRSRLGLAREARWDEVLHALAPLPVSGGKYLFAGSAPDSYSNPRWSRDHPAVVAALGVLPGAGVDPATMRRTFEWIWTHWDWTTTWGWDYPMLAMTAARLGDPAHAVDALLLDTTKNVYRPNGHNYQRPGLSIYLPGNGGLLYAVAMMAAGWDGGPSRHAPGFPADGSWIVRFEGLRKAP